MKIVGARIAASSALVRTLGAWSAKAIDRVHQRADGSGVLGPAGGQA
jgi:hypothetical protein